MKTPLTDQDITKAIRDLRKESPADPAWAGRAWMNIEAHLARKPVSTAFVFTPAVLRWAAVAACLLLAIGLTVRHQRNVEGDLGDYVINLYAQNPLLDEAEGEVAEPLLMSDGTGITSAGYDEDEQTPSVYDTLLEM